MTCALCFLGYARVILAGVSLQFMSYHPKYCTLAYCVSCLLDAVDGQAARALGQTSKFGAVLDMVTDRCVFLLFPTQFIARLFSSSLMSIITFAAYRCTTSCLLCYLCTVYPRQALIFQFLISLDFSSHFMHMYRCVVCPVVDIPN